MIQEYHQIKARHDKEIAQYMQKLADAGYSRCQAAQLLGKNTSSITNMVKKYNLNWPVKLSGSDGRRGHVAKNYIDLAEAGFSKTKTARLLGVHFNTVDYMAKKHKIKFVDGREKELNNA